MAKFEVLEDIPQSDLAALERGLAANATAKGALPYQSKPLGIFHRDAEGNVLAGLTGSFFWDWLYIDLLYVKEQQQRQGLGAQLMAEAETIARRQGCVGIYLWTESFEAPDFYQKHGYEIFCQFSDFPKGHQRIGLRKIFSAQQLSEKGRAA